MKKFLQSEKFQQYFRWSICVFGFVVLSLLFFILMASSFSVLFSVYSSYPEITEEQFRDALEAAACFGFGSMGLISVIAWLFNFPYQYDYDTGRFLKQLLDKFDAIDIEEDPE